MKTKKPLKIWPPTVIVYIVILKKKGKKKAGEREFPNINYALLSKGNIVFMKKFIFGFLIYLHVLKYPEFSF